jgi:hypothetical protein
VGAWANAAARPAIRIKPNDVTFHEETDSPVYADRRNF